jgi:hypothetical protein
MLFAAAHTGIMALTDVLVGALGHVMTEVLTPEEGKASAEQEAAAGNLKSTFTGHLLKGLGRSAIAIVELAAAVVAIVAVRPSKFLFVAGAAAIGSAFWRATQIPEERVRHLVDGKDPGRWYQVLPSGTWEDYAPSAIHALAGILVIVLALRLLSAPPPAAPARAV